jgi:hypothetical protein
MHLVFFIILCFYNKKGPTEECLQKMKEGTYFHFKDFGIKENSILFINDCESKEFESCTNNFLKEKLVKKFSKIKINIFY